MRKSMTMLGWAVWAAAQGLITAGEPGVTTSSGPVSAEAPNRSPVDLVLSPDENWLVTANQTSHTLSLVDVAAGSVIDELAVGRKPTGLAVLPGGFRVAVTCRDSGEVVVVDASDRRLRATATIPVGGHPWGIVVTPQAGGPTSRWQGSVKWPCWTSPPVPCCSGSRSGLGRGIWPCRRTKRGWPWALDGDRGVAVVDTQSHQVLYVERFAGLNIGQLQVSADGRHVYFPWMVYRRNPITDGNIRLGWVLASRIARLRMDGPARREAAVPGSARPGDRRSARLGADSRRVPDPGHRVGHPRTAGVPRGRFAAEGFRRHRPY